MNEVTVSIVCLTYNQERYIRQTLDGFLAQEADFNYEIVVHDDASTDSTPAIIEEYSLKYPDVFRPLLSTTNNYDKGLLYIYDIAIRHARGKYIAYCEGDDYFIDPHKLQKQVDFLESHPDHTLVHTGFMKYRDDKGKMSSFDSTRCPPPQGDVLETILIHNIITAPTVLFRRDLALEALSELVGKSMERQWLTPDYPLWLYFAGRGKIGYLTDVTTVYRYSRNSISSNKDAQRYISFLESVLDIKAYFIEKFGMGEAIKNKAIAKSACEIYQYALKSGFAPRDKQRDRFKQYAPYIDRYAPLKFCSRNTLFERFYR